MFPLLCLHDTYFYPRPPRGGRLDSGKLVPFYVDISIHALREEGDCYRRQRRSTSNKFLSTPSARRATVGESKNNATFANFYPRPPRGGRLTDPVYLDQTAKISIHALREEGDGRAFCYINDAAPYFYPRPPRGGRPAPDRWNMAATWYFYPRPPRGGRRGCAGLDPGKA